MLIATGPSTKFAVPGMRYVLGDKQDHTLIEMFSMLECPLTFQATGFRSMSTVVLNPNGFVIYCRDRQTNPTSYDLVAYVDPFCRRKGVGRELMGRLTNALTAFHNHKIPLSSVRTWHGSESADLFWQAVGVTPPFLRTDGGF